MNNTAAMPQIPTNIFSVGAWLDGVTSTAVLRRDGAYEVTGLYIQKDENGVLQAKITSNGLKIKRQLASRAGPGHVYMTSCKRYESTDQDNSCAFASRIATRLQEKAQYNLRDGKTSVPIIPQAQKMIYAALNYPDYVCASNFDVDQLTATQHKYALELLLKHNANGHVPKTYLR